MSNLEQFIRKPPCFLLCEITGMISITLSKLKSKPTKGGMEETDKLLEEGRKLGLKVLGFYYTLGRYDTVLISEGPDDPDAIKNLLKQLIKASEFASTETLIAVRRDEVEKMIST